MTSLWSKGKLFSVQNQSCSLPNSKQNLCRKDNGKHQINLAWGQRWKCLLANLFRREKYLVCNSIFDKQEVKSTYRYWHHNKYHKGGVYHWMLKAKMKWKGWKWSEAKFVANIKWKNFWCQCLFRGMALFHGGGVVDWSWGHSSQPHQSWWKNTKGYLATEKCLSSQTIVEHCGKQPTGPPLKTV